MNDAYKHVSAKVSLITDAFKNVFFSRVSATMKKTDVGWWSPKSFS